MPTPASVEKRREWEEKILKQRAGGLSIERWCNENQVKAHVFCYWRDKLFPKAALKRSSFEELTHAGTNSIVIEYRGFRIHLDRTFDPSLLKRCLVALKEIRC